VRHVLRNSLLPSITVVSAQVGYLVGGLVVVEKLFNYPASASSSTSRRSDTTCRCSKPRC